MGAKNQYKNFQFNTLKKEKQVSKITAFVEDELQKQADCFWC